MLDYEEGLAERLAKRLTGLSSITVTRSIRRGGDGPPNCSFCKKGQRRGRKVIRRADGLYICDECVDRVIAALSGKEIGRLSRE